uniref:Putative tick transposon n=1 Tax=Rhipicephalus microplus TaxID=6941 RepID=A0A6G5AAG1_RHIMP
MRVTPLELVFSRTVTTSLDAMLPLNDESSNPPGLDGFLQRADEARQMARYRIRRQQRIDSYRYNQRRTEAHFQPGDKVWICTPVRRRGLSEKLLSGYFGPYEVLHRVSDVTYQVRSAIHGSSKRRGPTEVVCVVRMKPYYERSPEDQ